MCLVLLLDVHHAYRIVINVLLALMDWEYLQILVLHVPTLIVSYVPVGLIFVLHVIQDLGRLLMEDVYHVIRVTVPNAPLISNLAKFVISGMVLPHQHRACPA